MRSTGMMRKTDKLGRIVIPIEMRNKLKINPYDEIELFTEGQSILLRKFEESCTICNSKTKLIKEKNKLICEKCIQKLYKKMNEENK